MASTPVEGGVEVGLEREDSALVRHVAVLRVKVVDQLHQREGPPAPRARQRKP